MRNFLLNFLEDPKDSEKDYEEDLEEIPGVLFPGTNNTLTDGIYFFLKIFF